MQKAKPKASGGSPRAKSRGFTLLELIIVIAILAILSVAVVLVINPAETLARARDSQRLSDLAAIKSSIGLYLAEVSSSNLDLDGVNAAADCAADIWIGTADTTPAITSAMCGVAAGVNAHWISSVGLVDGTGWIPVNLTAITGLGAPISNFPLDPTDNIPTATPGMARGTVNDANIYTYSCDNLLYTFELNANMESSRYGAGADSKEDSDGGNQVALYETGTDLTLCVAWGA